MPRYSGGSTDEQPANPASSSTVSIHEGLPVQPTSEHSDPQPPPKIHLSPSPSSNRRKSKKLTKQPPLGRELPPENPSFKGPTDVEPNPTDNTNINRNWPLSSASPPVQEPLRPSSRSRTRASYHPEPRNPKDKWDPSRHSLPANAYDYNYNYSLTTPTPGADNFGDVASGGIAGIAMGIADNNARNSGVEAMRYNTSYDARDAPTYGMEPEASAADPLVVNTDRRQSLTPPDSSRLMSPTRGGEKRLSTHSNTRNSLLPLTEDAASLGVASPTPSRSPSVAVSYMGDSGYSEAPNHRYSRNLDPSLITFDRFDPDSIEDDGDYGLHYPAQSRSKRTSMLSFHSNRGSVLSLSPSNAGIASPPKSARASTDHVASEAGAEAGVESVQPIQYNGLENYDEEKQEWERQEVRSNKRKMWFIALIILILIVGGGVGGIVGEYYVKKG